MVVHAASPSPAHGQMHVISHTWKGLTKVVFSERWHEARRTGNCWGCFCCSEASLACSREMTLERPCTGASVCLLYLLLSRQLPSSTWTHESRFLY